MHLFKFQSLLALVVLLALSNLGTSFAAAHLAKDTTTNEEDELVSKSTNEALSAQSTEDIIEMQRTNAIDLEGRRVLCERDGTEVTCDVESSFLSLDWRTCRRMMRHCKRGNTVSLSRTWTNGDTSHYKVCPYSGTMSKYRRSTLTNELGKTFRFEQTPGGHCRLEGDAITQELGGICALNDDCNEGLTCVEDAAIINACQNRCARRRYAPHRVDECKVDCLLPSCR
mmetsp:Transcript_40138/g.85459  ORF Transcript_40138/g.85459 Transcript_40138/m.85459 type:complete len:227 (+) Transcript_40138:1-681(+)